MVPRVRQTPAQRIAGEVRAELARKLRTQQQLAEALGLTQQATSRRLRGEVPFSGAELMLAADFLDVPVAHLLPPQSDRAGAA